MGMSLQKGKLVHSCFTNLAVSLSDAGRVECGAHSTILKATTSEAGSILVAKALMFQHNVVLCTKVNDFLSPS